MVTERDDEVREDQQDDATATWDDDAVADDTPLDADAATADDATESIRGLVTYLVYNLVDEPETVDISVERRGPSVHVELRLPEGEMGKVIGRGGRIAKAIRTVLLIAGSKHHLRVSLDIEG